MKSKDLRGKILPEDVSQVDTLTFQAFDTLSQTSSRRGFLARVGSLSLKFLGVGVAYQILPVGRDAAQAAVVSCSSWYLCGLTGNQCGCSACSGELDQCPSCACKGGSWTACCCTDRKSVV